MRIVSIRERVRLKVTRELVMASDEAAAKLVDSELLELPAGRIEKGEDPFEAAKRELTEETGYEAKQWKELARMYTAPGFCNEMLYLYEASDVEFVGTKFDSDEEIEILELPLAEAWQMVQAGKVLDAKTIAGLGMLVAANICNT